MANIIPLAGLGSRFSSEGYLLPKPLIPISGEPMILQAIKNLPPSDKWIFIIRQEHIDEFHIDQLITSAIPNAILIPVSETTAGQASSCALALPHLNQDESMIIAACDNSFLYDRSKLQALMADPSVDMAVWTFTGHPSLIDNPQSWGWIRLKDDGVTIDEVSVKVPISDDPIRDNAVVGAFYFRRAKDFKEAYEAMVKENYRTNGEFYLDSMPRFYTGLGRRSVIFGIDLYVGWGKPEDVRLYELWEYRVRMGLNTGPEFALWSNFFKSL